MRNPPSLVESWPKLWQAMAAGKKVLVQAWTDFEDLRGLTAACGKDPVREPPKASTLVELRRRLAVALGVPEEKVEDHHAASPWRFMLVEAVQHLAKDPDQVLVGWLRDGAPMGITQTIEPGGLFPAVVPSAELTLDQLNALERWSTNHPSFGKTYDSDVPPGVATVQGYLDAGFGRLFADAAAASAHFGVDVHPAPMGNITKVTADGALKHRPIQDLRRNGVNDAVLVPERQVLPRPVDHARDLADVASTRKPGDVVATLVLDFKDAFMSVPLHVGEQPFNCTVLPQGLALGREPLDEKEVTSGTCIVWRVLGFGGKPNPLVYSRAASFAMRTGQVVGRRMAGNPWASHGLSVSRRSFRLCSGSPLRRAPLLSRHSCMWMIQQFVREGRQIKLTKPLICCLAGGWRWGFLWPGAKARFIGRAAPMIGLAFGLRQSKMAQSSWSCRRPSCVTSCSCCGLSAVRRGPAACETRNALSAVQVGSRTLCLVRDPLWEDCMPRWLRPRRT